MQSMLQFCESCKHSIDTYKQSNNFDSFWKHKHNTQMVKCFSQCAWSCRWEQQNRSWQYGTHGFTQLEIEKHCDKFHHQTTKEQPKYSKSINMKVHCTNKIWLCLHTSMNVALCHVFMNDKIVEKLTLVELLLIFSLDSNVANPNVNIGDDATSPNVNIDDNANEKIWKNERYNSMMYMKKILKIWNHIWLFQFDITCLHVHFKQQ